MKWGLYHKLRPAQIDAIKRVTPMAYVPWGALEWHSYHNPVGLDGLIADELCQGLAERMGGLVLPPVYLATDTIKVAHNFPHSVEISQSLVSSMCTELCQQLVEEKFKYIVIVTGHCGGGHRDALGDAVSAFQSAHPEITTILVPAFDPVQDTWAVNHAAVGETSLQMHAEENLVDLSLLPKERAPTLDDDGVWGDDPREATAAKGQQILNLFVDRTEQIIHRAIESNLSE